MTNINLIPFEVAQNNCPIDIDKAMQCLANQATYLRCQRLPWVVYVAIAGLILLVIMDVVLLMKIRKERKRITEAGQVPQH